MQFGTVSDRQAIATPLICGRGQEDGRNDMARSGDSPMQLEAAHFRHPNVRNQTGDFVQAGHSVAGNVIASSPIPQWCPQSLLSLRHHGPRPRFGRYLRRFHAHCLSRSIFSQFCCEPSLTRIARLQVMAVHDCLKSTLMSRRLNLRR
jgi:hypothetical protein